MTTRVHLAGSSLSYSILVASFAGLITMAATGCTTPLKWVPDEGPEGRRRSFEAACELEAIRSFYSSEESSEERDARVKSQTALCMKAKGYKQVDDVPAAE